MKLRKALLQLFKVTVSVGLIVFLVWKISPSRIAANLKEVNPLFIAAAAGVFTVSSVLGALQWFILLRESGMKITFPAAVRFYFIGLFFNNFLPANVGGDAFKIFDVSRKGYDPHRVFAITLLDRIFGILGLCTVALAASLILLPGGMIGNIYLYILLFGGIIASGVVMMFSRPVSRLVRRVFSGIKLMNIGSRATIIFNQLGELRNIRPVMLRVTCLALLVQSLRICTHIMVGGALGLDLSGQVPLYFFLFVPLLGLLMILPISINGLGVREGAGVLLFAGVSISGDQALLIEFLTYVIMVMVSLAGGALFLRRQLTRN
ncbi:MAG: flippase-like domain-containing protein [Candidatus Latescibacteria bacterium]|nr:flippase-like domain-containing protein [bacterium]MBD3424549.1 flippase-like domain-containing protein [Candidatus Latescibacterota bacterium]